MDFFTADICDSHFESVAVLEEGYKNFGGTSKCHGTIVTVKLDKNNAELAQILRDEDGEGKVVVVDVEREYFAVVGENLMKLAAKNNYSGIIVNGYIRDTFQIKEIPVALYALGTCPRKYIPTTKGERALSLLFGGVRFNSGEYLYADTDGIVVTKKPLHIS